MGQEKIGYWSRKIRMSVKKKGDIGKKEYRGQKKRVNRSIKKRVSVRKKRLSVNNKRGYWSRKTRILVKKEKDIG